MHHVFGWVDTWMSTRCCSRKEAASLLTGGKSGYRRKVWLTIGEVSNGRVTNGKGV